MVGAERVSLGGCSRRWWRSCKGSSLLPTMRLPPGVRTPQKQVHHDSLPPSKSADALLTSEVQTPQKEVHHDSLPPLKVVAALLGRPHQHPAALAPAQCYSQSSIHRWSIVASVPLLPAKASKGAGAWLLLRSCTVAAVVPLVSAKASKGVGAWLLLRRCTVATVVPLVPAKAREGVGAWVPRRRCTMATVVPLVPAKAREGAGGWLLLRRQCCTVAAAVVSHERFHTITRTTTILRRRP